jgi:hypothetical protein
MLGDSGLGQFETLPDLLDITTLGKKPGDDLQTDGMPEDFKDFRLTLEIGVLVEFLLRHGLLSPWVEIKSAAHTLFSYMDKV